MKKAKDIGHFAKNGFSVLRDASIGGYVRESSVIDELRKEMMDMPPRTISNDKRNLIEDRKSISKDLRKAYNKIALRNG